jgi:diguanylate cyclase (GGDEF)-like protein
MPPIHQRALSELTARLTAASTVPAACQAAATVLGRCVPARVSVLLPVHDRLRRVASTGSCRAGATVRQGNGLVGRVYATGQAAVVSAGSDPAAELCVPLRDPTGHTLGVLDLEWRTPADPERWRPLAERVAGRLTDRIGQLGGPPAESRSERVLRHVTTMTAAPDEPRLRAAARAAATDITGYAVAVLVPDAAGTAGDQPVGGTAEQGNPEERDGLAARVRAVLRNAGPAGTELLTSCSRRYGTAYTLGGGGKPTMPHHDLFTGVGAGTLLTVPVGPAAEGGVLVLADERVHRPDPVDLHLVELLAGQLRTCLDRLRTLDRLRQLASSDPLTGLRHHGPFGERMSGTTPGRTALLAIDVDSFKSVNDTYGHQAGDRLLVDLARALESALRQGDELYRLGGDEFVAVVEVNRAEEAVGIAERLTEAARRIDHTISVGVALRHSDEPPELTLQRADAALYEVKRRGRDGVRLAAD